MNARLKPLQLVYKNSKNKQSVVWISQLITLEDSMLN